MNTSSDEHLGDLVELYALGALDETETLRVHEHGARCVRCARLLGEAEATITFLDEATIPKVIPRRALRQRLPFARTKAGARVSLPHTIRYAALAASLLLIAGGAFGAREVLQMRAVVAQDDVALGFIATSHFLHSSFTKVQPDAPTAKVLWGRSSRWIYVVVDAPACHCRIVADTVAGEQDLGIPLSRGKTATLFVRDGTGMLRLNLREGARNIATARLK